MKPEMLPGPGTAAETQWVEGELVRNLMLTQRNTHWIALLLVVLFLALLRQDAAPWALAAWGVAATLVAGGRYRVLRLYGGQVAARGAAEHLAFLRRTRAIWPVSAFVWGLTALLYLDRAPLADQFIGWLILAATAMFAINSLSSHLPTMRAYLDTLVGTVLAVVAWRLLQAPTAYHAWLLALVVPFWHILRRTGARLHQTHRRNFELQFRNTQLIDSLTRQTQAALDAVEIKNRFLASAAHDIRQPVHALSLYADWLASEPELAREIAPKIVESTKAVNRLFDSLFDLARLDSGKIRLHVQAVDLARLLHDVELQYRPLAEAKGLQFRLRVKAAWAVSDPILLQRVVGNLVSNAVKYTQRGGVLLAARGTAAGPRIEVWDTGIGIPAVYQREIFREFYKVPNHPGTEDGFGLGLYIVGRLARILGHPLHFASKPGRGTVFRLLLRPTDPRSAAQLASKP